MVIDTTKTMVELKMDTNTIKPMWFLGHPTGPPFVVFSSSFAMISLRAMSISPRAVFAAAVRAAA